MFEPAGPFFLAGLQAEAAVMRDEVAALRSTANRHEWEVRGNAEQQP
jgi:hypothetical protein